MRTAKTDQTGRMPRLILVFGGRTVTLLFLSCHGSIMNIMGPVHNPIVILKLSLIVAYCVHTLMNMSPDMTKPTKWHVRPAKNQISLGIRPV